MAIELNWKGSEKTTMVDVRDLLEDKRLQKTSEGFSGVLAKNISVAEVEEALRRHLNRPVECKVVASNNEVFALLCTITREG